MAQEMLSGCELLLGTREGRTGKKETGANPVNLDTNSLDEFLLGLPVTPLDVRPPV